MRAEAQRTTTGPCLGVVRDLTDRLDRAGIRFCQFKSNQHLEAGLSGLTDIDVLVDRFAGPALPRVLSEAGCKRFSAPPGALYPAVEDYLALDRETGRLIHLHLHHRLTAGERHLKGYRLPFEDLILSTRRRDEASGFYTADPDVEFMFFAVRASLKIRMWERILGQWAILVFRGQEGEEWVWLQDRIQPARLAEIARAHVGERAAGHLERIRVNPSLAELIRLKRAMVPPPRLYRTFTPIGATFTRWRREFLLLSSRVGKRWLSLPGPVSRTDPRGGVLIAIVGPDGSGKSTLVREIDRWLRWKIDSRLVYFGSGDGPSSWLRWPMKVAAGIVKAGRLRRTPGGSAPQPADATPRTGDSAPMPGSPDGNAGVRAGAAERLARALWALALAAEKRRSLRRAWRFRNRGMVVLCDRYPQNQVMGFNDGPLLSRWNGHSSRLLRALARWEAVPYAWADAIPPDMVIKLHVTPEVSRQRKPEVRLDDIRRREQAVTGFRYPPQTRIADIDAARPWEEVLLDAKRHVWEML